MMTSSPLRSVANQIAHRGKVARDAVTRLEWSLARLSSLQGSTALHPLLGNLEEAAQDLDRYLSELDAAILSLPDRATLASEPCAPA